MTSKLVNKNIFEEQKLNTDRPMQMQFESLNFKRITVSSNVTSNDQNKE